MSVLYNFTNHNTIEFLCSNQIQLRSFIQIKYKSVVIQGFKRLDPERRLWKILCAEKLVGLWDVFVLYHVFRFVDFPRDEVVAHHLEQCVVVDEEEYENGEEVVPGERAE